MKRLCKLLGAAFSIDCGFWGEHRPLDVAGCAKLSALRAGEAKNPGPRRAAPPRPQGGLEDVQLLEPVTVALRNKLWKVFVDWFAANMGAEDPSEWAFRSPQAFGAVMVAYGHALYDAGSSLHYYRQLLAHVQKLHVQVKPFLSEAWEVATKWQAVEPVEHRPPIPESLVLAMVSLAWLWRWKRWAAITLYTFSAISRVGEVLTPSDILFEQEVIYLQVSRPKTRNRGPKVQYSSADWKPCVQLVSVVWDTLLPDEPLFPGSPAAFRFRWDALLRHLNVSASFQLTPASLRSGGAVAAHRRQVSINDLMWKMRITHQKTLTHYLQEVAASSILPQLAANVRSNIMLLKELMPCLCQTRGPQRTTASVVTT